MALPFVKRAQKQAALASPHDNRPQHPADWIASHTDAHAALWHQRTTNPEGRRSVYLGMSENGFVIGEPDTHLLAIAPARGPGKTAGVAHPNVTWHVGPKLISDMKLQDLNEVLMVLARVGPLLWLPFARPAIPGTAEIRVDLFAAYKAHTMKGAAALAKVLLAASNPSAASRGTGVSDTGGHFYKQARAVLTALIYRAASTGLTMEWVCQMVTATPDEIEQELFPAIQQMLTHKDTAGIGRTLRRIITGEERELNATVTTMINATECFGLAEVQRCMTKGPGDTAVLDPAAFVRGNPTAFNYHLCGDYNESTASMLGSIGVGFQGTYDTLLMIGDDEDTYDVMTPFLVAVVTMIKKAAAELHETDHQDYPNTLFLLDEMTVATPLPDLLKWLATLGSRGVTCVALVQSGSQLRDLYGPIAASDMSLWNNVITLAGVGDMELAKVLCDMVPPVWIDVPGYSRDHEGKMSWNHTRQQLPGLTPDQVFSGVANQPDVASLFSHSGGRRHLWLTPSYRSTPWPHVIVSAMAHWWKHLDDPASLLPIPRLDQDGTGRYLGQLIYGQSLLTDYRTVAADLRAHQHNAALALALEGQESEELLWCTT
jgi:hypothetical protein